MMLLLRYLLLSSFATGFLHPVAPRRSSVVHSSEEKDPEIELVESVFKKSHQPRPSGGDDGAERVFSLGGDEERKADIHLPTTGVSVSESMDDAQRDRFASELVPVTTLKGVAQIVTKATKGSFDPIRYLVALTPPSDVDEDGIPTEPQQYVMTDIPPYSDQLASMIRKYIGSEGQLVGICMTSKNGVHYDEGPGVFTNRQSDLSDWKSVFPGLAVVGYRLDIPRDCSPKITQKLNGYGPWAWNDENEVFEESGQPLIVKEWDTQSIKTMLNKGIVPPQEDEDEDDVGEHTPESIKEKEAGKRLLAVFTPGHTHGTLSYVFPETNVVVSGFTIPVEDSGAVNQGQFAGPAMDARGYITTSGAGMTKQMESARQLVNTYGDRFGIVLPSRDDPLFLDELSVQDRKSAILRIIDQYDEIGQIYSQLGILSDDDNDETLSP